MSGHGMTFEVLHWVYIETPLVCGTTADRGSRPHPDDIEAEFAKSLIVGVAGRWWLTVAGEIRLASLQGCMAGAR